MEVNILDSLLKNSSPPVTLLDDGKRYVKIRRDSQLNDERDVVLRFKDLVQ